MTLAFSPDCLCTKCWAIFHKCCTSMKTPLFSSSWLYLDCLQVIPPCCLLPAAGDVVGMGTGSFSMFPAAQLKRAGKTWTEHLLLHSRVFSQRLGHQKQGKGCDAVMDFPSQGWFHLAAQAAKQQYLSLPGLPSPNLGCCCSGAGASCWHEPAWWSCRPAASSPTPGKWPGPTWAACDRQEEKGWARAPSCPMSIQM